VNYFYDRKEAPPDPMANQLGKVYVCTKCGSQVIVTKAGAGALKCCGAPMELKK
jgi:desulfoferrodoxin-like iron-binding protein